jgi:adenine deaminase
MKIVGRVLDWQQRLFVTAEILVEDGFIVSITPTDADVSQYILPGLIDSHLHVESSMLMPSTFSELVVSRGTIGLVADPHEIANACGLKGVEAMLDNAMSTPVKFFFGAPSCVPATMLELSGAILDAGCVSDLLMRDDIWFLSEMMNYPGVISRDSEVMAKIASAQRLNKPVDGHAPGLNGVHLDCYIEVGISTDHECFSLEEALEKIRKGMMIQIREGSAARNLNSLYPLLSQFPYRVMLCTDDSHPHQIIHEGHMDRLVRSALHLGVSYFDLVYAVSVNPVKHYQLPVGLLRVGDRADFIVVDSDLLSFKVKQTYIDGELVYDHGQLLFDCVPPKIVNQFEAVPVNLDLLKLSFPPNVTFLKVIDVMDGELITSQYLYPLANGISEGELLQQDILKIVVLNRYRLSKPSVGFVRGFGLKRGAIASSVAHDSHHVIAVGTSDQDIVLAMNTVIHHCGGIVVADEQIHVLPLPIGGIISDQSGSVVAEKYEMLEKAAKEMGSVLQSPFMSLSFLSLLVIPDLKLGANGLFDVNRFEFVSLFE